MKRDLTQMIKVLSFAIVIFLSSCKGEHGEPNNVTPINSIDGKYLFTNEEHNNTSKASGTASFAYYNNKLVKRVGGYIPVVPGSIYATEVFDTLEYNGADMITIGHKDWLEGLDVAPGKREFTFTNGNLTKKISYDNNGNNLNNDTILYFYSPDKKIVKTEQYFLNKYLVKNFSFK